MEAFPLAVIWQNLVVASEANKFSPLCSPKSEVKQILRRFCSFVINFFPIDAFCNDSGQVGKYSNSFLDLRVFFSWVKEGISWIICFGSGPDEK